MAKIKTRDLILDVALILFNVRGESQVSSVDLANEMNISPGNLYYHFKGKEEVVEELYARFHAGLSVLMDDIRDAGDLDLDGTLLYLLLVADFLAEYRFITQDTMAIGFRYSNLQRPLGMSFKRLHALLCELMGKLASGAQNTIDQDVLVRLADNLLSTLVNVRTILVVTGQVMSNEQPAIKEHIYLQLLPVI